jgi:hypothetical protein
MTSIVSGSGAARVTDDVRQAVLAISRRQDLNANSASGDDVVPFCVLKFVEGSESTLAIDILSTLGDDQADDHHQRVPSTWDQLVASLPRDQCRMALAQVPWTAHSDNVTRSRLVFILWAPSHGPSIKQRMTASMFSKGVERMVEQWVGMPVRVEAAGVDDLELADVRDKIRSKATVK